jgi:hypothetical protein
MGAYMIQGQWNGEPFLYSFLSISAQQSFSSAFPSLGFSSAVVSVSLEGGN